MRAVAFAMIGFAVLAQVPPARAQSADCIEIGVHSNGYHVDLVVPAAALAPEHPIRSLAP